MSFTQDHGFFLLLAYGVSGLLLVVELALLLNRSRAARRLREEMNE